MASIKLFIATSLDGYIASPDGGVDWLFTDGDYGYSDFIAGIGALIMGRKTYDQVLTFGAWPYQERLAHVFTHHPPPEADHPHARFVSGDPRQVVARLREESDRDLWLVGGGGLIAAFREHGLIDEYILSVHPILLGEGIPLFPTGGEGGPPRQDLRLAQATPYPSGLVQLRYVKV